MNLEIGCHPRKVSYQFRLIINNICNDDDDDDDDAILLFLFLGSTYVCLHLDHHKH